MARNVLGTNLQVCGLSPLTGFTRNGCCDTGPEDLGSHTVCVQVTDEFLAFSKSQGNDLSTPRPEYAFDGLQAGDRWCVCATWIAGLDGHCYYQRHENVSLFAPRQDPLRGNGLR